ncbi:MAG: helix-turn-helix domain-containing protein [Candidatus Limimorpha sp.]
MIKQAVRYQIVEHMTRLGDASLRQTGDTHEGFSQTYHFHNTLEVIVIKQGWIEGVVGGIVGKIQLGTVVVIGNDLPHCVLRVSDDCKAILVHVPSELLKWDEGRFPELAHGIDFLRNSRNGMVFADATFAGKITRIAGQIASADGFLRMSLLMRMLHILSITQPTSTLQAERHTSHRQNKQESSVDRAYRYLYEHFREPFSLSDIAAYSGQNPSALCRAFKKASGYTVGQFCTRLRMEYACNLLLTTNVDISQIAYSSGFNSYPHFCTQFKIAMRMSPTAYRNKSAI